MAAAEVVPIFLRILASSVSVARHAGGIVRKVIASGQLNIVDKGSNDFQTEADRAAQRCIIGSLRQHFPTLTVIGEEGDIQKDCDVSQFCTEMDYSVLNCSVPSALADLDEIERIVVWVDPLDGTREFADGLLEHVTVLIGISVNGIATAGVIHQPFYGYQRNDDLVMPPGRTIWGIRGGIVHGLTPSKQLPAGRIIATTRVHSDMVLEQAVSSCNPTDVMRVGGCGYKILLLLENQAHVYVFASAGCKKWDTCAPEAVLEACGGKLTDILGNHITYSADVQPSNKTGVLATAFSVNHNEYVNCMPEAVREIMKSK